MFAHKMGAAKQAQVLRDGWTGYWKRAGDLPGRLTAPAEQIEDGSAGWVRQSLERRFPRSRV
jgi:hypothetical protein